jgi:hypothetical protein
MNNEGIEQVANWLNDQDREWGPFLFLRPEQHERMGSRRVAALSALYGVLAGLFVNVLLVLSGRDAHSFNPFLFPVGATLGFFMIYRFTFAYFWNRRAERLALRGMRSE